MYTGMSVRKFIWGRGNIALMKRILSCHFFIERLGEKHAYDSLSNENLTFQMKEISVH